MVKVANLEKGGNVQNDKKAGAIMPFGRHKTKDF